MNNIQVFNNKEFGEIRAVQINNTPYFNLKDICRILDIKNSSDAKTRLSQDGVATTEVGVQTGIKSDGTPAIQKVQATFINESNLYKLIFQSRKAEAEKFTEWVTSEVLPNIRKFGMYAKDELLDNPDLLLDVITKYKEEREKTKLLEEQIQQDKPKVLFADAVSASHTSILIGDLAKLLKQNGYDTGQKRLFEELRNEGYLIKQKGDSYNMPTQKSMNLELFEVKETTINNPDGSIRITKTPKVTGKGQQYFINMFLAKTA